MQKGMWNLVRHLDRWHVIDECGCLLAVGESPIGAVGKAMHNLKKKIKRKMKPLFK